MTDPTPAQPTPESAVQSSSPAEGSKPSGSASGDSSYVPPTPLRCFTGSAIAGGFAYVLYLLTQSIITSFAAKPLSSTNMLAARIGAAVRTLVVGISTLGTGIFAIAAVGLLALGIQLVFKQLRRTDAG
ncbi:DUF3082 domain-containing protein [Leptolyngbya ohadii]|uniref:DUF3082 domain-containing protein n=1 Tax=Leptolyngbya ohadii TaxID=1962290 RepID=UPI000B5984FB|nr:DUF3082 domain-containing protein [Leptolyngbya ohadii]